MTTGASLGWRRWFASTGTPPMWRPVVYAVAGLLVGGALGVLLAPQKGTVLAALTGALTAAAGSAKTSRTHHTLLYSNRESAYALVEAMLA